MRYKFFFSRTMWKKILYYVKTHNIKFYDKYILHVNSKLPKFLINQKLFFYNGRYWITRIGSRWMVGYSAGSFLWTRKLAFYKVKQLKKKKKK